MDLFHFVHHVKMVYLFSALKVEGQAAKYRALAQTLREMALLEANMQNIAQSGQQVLHRLTHVETQK